MKNDNKSIIMNQYKVKRVMVVGAGTMGHAIAQVYAQNGMEVNLIDKEVKALERAKKLIKNNLDLLSKHNHIDSNQIPEILERLKFSNNLEDSAEKVDLAIEAVNEVPEIKKLVYQELNEYCSKNTIIASNTSGLNIFELADIENPQRLIIHHWFCPAYIIPLVEIIPGEATSKKLIQFSINLMENLGKKPVVLKEFISNFIVNRIQRVIMVQTWELIQKGWATPEQIDLAIKHSLGVRLPVQGIVQSQDFTGLDLILDKQKEFKINTRYQQIEDMVNKGNLGVKTGNGFYDYGNRSEEELLRERDDKCLKMLDFLEKIEALRNI